MDSLLKSIRRVIPMESKLQDLSDGVTEMSQRIVDHEGPLIRIETMIDVARRSASGPDTPSLPGTS